jgi:acetylornithine deacetylase/succinyl-diaminopimelate desuccinylase-like protein
VIAERRPAGMVLVRNETGVSHSPDEEVSLDDAAVAANALLAAAQELA